MKVNITKLMKRGMALFLAMSVVVSGLMIAPMTSNAAVTTTSGVFDSAISIEPGTEVKGAVTKDTPTSNVVAYKINLPSTGKLSLDLTSYIDSKTSFSVYNTDGTPLKTENNMSWDSTILQLHKTYDLYLTKGLYYILISGHSTDSDSYGNFKFTTLFTSTSVTTSETNNEFSTAYNIKLSKTNIGQLSVNDLDDYYKFTVATTGYYNIKILTGLNPLSYTLFNEDGDEYDSGSVYVNKRTKKGAGNSLSYLDKGTYVLQVSDFTEHDTNGVYSVKVSTCVTKIKLNKKSLALKKGKTFTLKATTTPTTAENKKLTWTSSKPATATVSSKGKVTAKKKGTCYIYCTAQDEGSRNIKIKVVVK